MNLPELLQLSGGYWATCALHAAVKLDLFTALADVAMSVPEQACLLAVDERGLGMLVRALVALDLLEAAEGGYRCTSFSATYLSRNSATYMGYIILHHHHLVEGWSHLDEAVKTGAPVRRRSSHDVSDNERESFLMGMYNLASLLAPRVAQAIDLTGRSRLLDLAGGPGTYAIQFCLKNPELRADIYDLPTTRPFAEKVIGRFRLQERVSFVSGDLLNNPLGSGYDVVWISHLLHSESPADSARIVEKAAAALNPDGLLLIQEFVLDDQKTAPLFPALFSLNMLVGTVAGQAYSWQELTGMMAGAGLTGIRRLPLELPNGAGILAGIRE